MKKKNNYLESRLESSTAAASADRADEGLIVSRFEVGPDEVRSAEEMRRLFYKASTYGFVDNVTSVTFVRPIRCSCQPRCIDKCFLWMSSCGVALRAFKPREAETRRCACNPSLLVRRT